MAPRLVPALRPCECGCGLPVQPPRTGSRPKRFATGACRARWHRQRKAERPQKPPASQDGAQDRLEMLQRICAELKADIEDRGSVVGGRVNPSVDMFRKITLDIARLAPVELPEDAEPELEIAI